MSILIFFLVLFVLVLVHEWGHFIVAKKSGMRVDEFGIGFPPKLFGWRRGETEYTFNLLPIGGFVRIFGEDPDKHEDSEAIEGSFSSKSKKAQAAVLIAGITMNILFAWLLFMIALMVGVQSFVAEEDAGATAQLAITGVLPESPAAVAGVQPGTVITAATVEGTTLETLTPGAFTDFVAQHPGVPVTLAYTYAGEAQQVQVVSAPGVLEEAVDRHALGVALAMVEVVSKPIHVAFVDSAVQTVVALKDITIGISALLQVLP